MRLLLGKETQEKSLAHSLTTLSRILAFNFGNRSKGSNRRTIVRFPKLDKVCLNSEIKIQRAWYRVVYLSRIDDVIHVLHCFEKKSKEIPKNDVDTARRRLKVVKARILQEGHHAKRQP